MDYTEIRHSKSNSNRPTQGTKFFIAKIVFHIVTYSPTRNSQFEEQLRLVEADTKEEALLKARGIGISQEEVLKQHDGDIIKWEFVDVADLVPLQALSNGAEIYSQIHETNESREYIHSIHLRGMDLRLNANQSYL